MKQWKPGTGSNNLPTDIKKTEMHQDNFQLECGNNISFNVWHIIDDIIYKMEISM